MFEIRGEGVHAAASLLRDGSADLSRHLLCRCPFSSRVTKDMQSRKSELLDEGDRLLELFVGLPREADDDVGGDGKIGHRTTSVSNQRGELLTSGTSGHAFQGFVATTLQRKVEVRQQPWVRKDLEEPGVEVPRFERGEPQPLDRGLREGALDEVLQAALVSEIVAVGAEVDAAQNDFPVAQSLELVELFHDGVRRDTAARPSGDCDHAEGATVVATVLDLEKGAGPRGIAGFEELQLVGIGGRHVEKTFGLGEFEQPFLLGVADNQINTYLDHLGRGKLGVAAGDDERR